jgi:hypothetical protein
MPTRPLTFRPEPVALGALALTLSLGLVRQRFGGDWDAGVFFVLFALGAAALLFVALGALPATGWLAVPVLAGMLLVLGALTALADALGGDGGPGSTFWTVALFCALSIALWRRTGIDVLVLVAALAAIVAVLAFVSWIADPGLDTLRGLLLFLAVAFGSGGVVLHRTRPRVGVLLIDAGGVALLALGFTLAATLFNSFVSPFSARPTASSVGGPAGWEIVLLLGGSALIVFAALAREPGPGFLGVGVLGLFLLEAGLEDNASLLWWPVVLAVVGIAGLAAGLLRPGPPDAGVPARSGPAPPVGTAGAPVSPPGSDA